MKNKLIGLAAGMLICTATVMADTFPNTLWVGNDGTAPAPIFNTTTTGVVLQQIDGADAVGLAIDSNKLYVNSSTTTGGNIYHIDTLTKTGDTFKVPASFDMTFFGGFLWTAGFDGSIYKVDPVTQKAVVEFIVDFIPVGLTTDGAGGFWVSGFLNGAGQVLRHFNTSFVADADIDTSDIDGIGGLGFDPRDNTLFIGSLGKVYHYATDGTDLGFFVLPDDTQFVNGLEFEPATAVPEPTSIVLLGTVALAVAGIRRRLHVRR